MGNYAQTNKGKKMKINVIVNCDTTAVLDTDGLDSDTENFIGQEVTVTIKDENGNFEKIQAILTEILD